MNGFFHIYISLLDAWCHAGERGTETRSGWVAFWVIVIGLAMAAAGGYLINKYRLRVSCFAHCIFLDHMCNLSLKLRIFEGLVLCHVKEVKKKRK